MNGAATVFIVNDAQEVRGGLARLFAAAGIRYVNSNQRSIF
jgi:FixJ family two-component response regulator